MGDTKFQRTFEVLKTEKTQGLVFGWALTCSVDGKDYYDHHNDHIPEDVMLKATTDFMLYSRIGKEMHEGDPKAVIVHSFPLTTEIKSLFKIECPMSGWIVCMKVFDEGMLAKFADGEYSGFSIGGFCFGSEVISE